MGDKNIHTNLWDTGYNGCFFGIWFFRYQSLFLTRNKICGLFSLHFCHISPRSNLKSAMTSRSRSTFQSRPPGSFSVVKISENNSGSQNSSNANWIFLMSWRRSRPPKNHGSSLESLIRYRPGHNIQELFDIG